MDNKNSRDATKAASFYSTFATLLINLLICIVFVELVARIYTGRPDQQQDVRTQLPYYANQAWSDQYWQEFGSIDRSYQPHTIWRRNEFRGRYINVGKDGLRATPQSDCASAEKTVFMFGGSAMWGEGAPDTETVPSYLLQEIERNFEGSACVINFAESAWTSTQSLITLIAEIQKEHIPDLVVFYDGVNDTNVVFTSGKRFTHANLSEFTTRFEKEATPFHTRVMRNSAVFSVLYRYVKRQKLDSGQPLLVFDKDADALSDYIATTYVQNYQIVGALAEQYGFDYAFFWQPVIGYGEKVLTPEEDVMLQDADEIRIKLDEETYGRMQFIHSLYDTIAPVLDPLEYVYNLSHVFDDKTKSMYIDFVHVTPEANQMVAAEMFGRLETQLQN